MIFLSGSARIPTNLVQVSDIQSKANSYVIVQKSYQFIPAIRARVINNVYRYTLPVSSPWLSFEDSFVDILPILSTQINSEPELLLVCFFFIIK